MVCRFSELRCKEVINTEDGCRLGFVEDLELDTRDGRILALIVPGPGKVLGMFGKTDNIVIPWPCIKRIGEDIILVDVEREKNTEPCRKKRPF